MSGLYLLRRLLLPLLGTISLPNPLIYTIAKYYVLLLHTSCNHTGQLLAVAHRVNHPFARVSKAELVEPAGGIDEGRSAWHAGNGGQRHSLWPCVRVLLTKDECFEEERIGVVVAADKVVEGGLVELARLSLGRCMARSLELSHNGRKQVAP